MVSTIILCKCWKDTSQTESKEQKLMMQIVLWNFVWSTKRSTLGPLPFNIYICNMLFDINDCDFASYADGNSSYASRSNLGAVINNK